MSTMLLDAPTGKRPTPALPGQTFVIYSADWAMYEGFRALMGDGVRLTYDRGRLELMSPSFRHETAGGVLGRFIETIGEELDIYLRAGRSTTFRRQDLDRGLEPDECFYLANAPLIAGKVEIDLSIDPPPDLAIEIDITRSSLDRFLIYAALGVPEVWRYDDATLEIYALGPNDVSYTRVERSASFPMLDPADLLPFLARRSDGNDSALGREFRAWVRANLMPPAAGDAP